MPKYMIQRELPGASDLSPDGLQRIAQRSNEVLRELGPDIQWVQSYVGDDEIVCVYNSANEELIRDNARRGGFPCTTITKVGTVIDPVTAEV